jgi:hypothetical protein
LLPFSARIAFAVCVFLSAADQLSAADHLKVFNDTAGNIKFTIYSERAERGKFATVEIAPQESKDINLTSPDRFQADVTYTYEGSDASGRDATFTWRYKSGWMHLRRALARQGDETLYIAETFSGEAGAEPRAPRVHLALKDEQSGKEHERYGLSRIRR